MITTVISLPVVAGHKGSFDMRLMARTGAAAHVHIVAGSRRGFLVPDTVAHDLHLSPGDRLHLRFNQAGQFFNQPLPPTGPDVHTVSVQVGGIYRNLVSETARPYWSNLTHYIQPPSPDQAPPPPFIIGPQRAVAGLLHDLKQLTATFDWELPLQTRPSLSVEQARVTAHDLQALGERLAEAGTPLGSVFYCNLCRFSPSGVAVQGAGIGGEIKQVDDRLTALTPPVQSISGAGAIVALAVITSAGVYGARRRRAETSLLLARGWRPGPIALRSTLENVLPVIAGAVTGFLFALRLVALLGPSASADPVAVHQSLERIAVALPVGLIALFLVAVFGARSLADPTREQGRRRFGIFPWELLVAAGAVATYTTTAGHSISFSGSKATAATYLLLGFPLLVLLAASGTLARGLRWGLTRLAGSAERLRAAPFLAISRLGVSTSIAIALLTAAAVSLGLFTYAQGMVASLEATTVAKASVFTGGDATVAADFGYKPPASFPLPTSSIHQITSSATFGGGTNVGLLVIDPRTFAGAARWSDSFSSITLDEMMTSLDRNTSTRLPFVAVGSTGLEGASQMMLQGIQIPVRPVASADAFPGIFGDTPWMVVAAGPFSQAVQKAGGTDPLTYAGVSQLLVGGDPGKAIPALKSLGFSTSDILTADRILKQPTYLAARSTLKVLRALGMAAGLLSVMAILLYLQVRQRERSLANALSTRMGLMEGQHLLAVAIELGAILLMAAIIALAGGFAVTALTHSWLDPVPNVPPVPLLVLPLLLIPLLLIGVTAVALLGAGLAQWSSHRTRLAEEMRRVG